MMPEKEETDAINMDFDIFAAWKNHSNRSC